MDTEKNFPPYSSKRNGKLPQSLPQSYNPQLDESHEQPLDLSWLFAVVRRRAGAIIGATIVLAAISGSVIVWKSKSVAPTYEGSFRLLVEPVTAQARLAQQFLMSQTEAGADIQKIKIDETSLLDYETQIRVLRSPKLITPILEKIQTQYPATSYNSLTSNLTIKRVTFEQDGKLQGTKILQVNYLDSDSAKIRFVLKHVAESYLKYSLDERQSSLRQGIDFLDQQLPTLSTQVNTLQGQLQTLREQYNVINPETAGDLLSEHAMLIQRERLDTEATLAETKVLYKTLQGLLNQDNPTSVLNQNANAYEKLLGEIQNLETKIAIDSSLFREDSPPMKIRREQQENLENISRQQAEGVLEELEGKIEGLEERYQTITKTENQVNQKIRNLPEAARQYHDLQQKLEVATDTLKEFLRKREALKLDAAQQEVPWQLIEGPKIPQNEAGTLTPAESQQTKRQLAIAVLLSFLLGIGIGFMIEVLHTVFHTPEEIKGRTRLPILGVVPFTKKLKKLPKKSNQLAIVSQISGLKSDKKFRLWPSNGDWVNRTNTFSFMEAFRSLYTNIRLLSSKKPIYSLAISSAGTSDGKTTTAMYLAQTAAAIGQRVLLVDADLRCPQLHSRLNLPNMYGLSDIIATDINFDDAIQESGLNENCFVLTAGQSLSDPIKLLSSEKMQKLMDQLPNHFDLVIYDTPPLLGLGDSNLIAAHADGTLLVVGLGKTDRSLLMKALDGLTIAGASILGIVANGIEGYQNHSDATYSRKYG